MIVVTPQIKKKYPKAFSAARKCKFRVVWLRDDLIYCARKSKGHNDYIVRVFATPSINGGHQVKMQCRDTQGNECKGEKFNGLCAHLAAVILRTEKKPDKKQKETQAA